MKMKHYLNRCYQVFANRGVKGFFVFLRERIIRCDRDLVFEYKKHIDTEGEVNVKDDINYTVNIIDRDTIENIKHHEALEAALSNESQDYKAGLYEQDVLFVVLKKSELVHTTFIQFESKYKRILGEGAEVPLIGNCWTSVKCRGQGVYPYILKLACKRMINSGFSRVVITCDPSNLASIAGIKKAGFYLNKEITSYILMNNLAIQVVVQNNIKTYRFKYL
ncbi:GNAT family N-acetyltransferase [Colwellia ponticola]|uniref:GNAT family N-acetyltransferase n=1 Tax=Colwellia ponticola TaxID=2304625 RepID=A0A8H2JLQ8_9GAMM|nr:GNAT family N-acetyltransferase [Colwellia ponticola]TMM45274.1 GNAT family N-acetyltransferase [Colwellia ponticola]